MENAFPLLDAQDVTFSHQGRRLLQPVSLQLNRGDWLVLNGPSGSGKSTLLKILASLLTPGTGQVRFNGRDITTLRPETYRQQVSYCFQAPQLFGATVYENLAFPWQLRQQTPPRDRLIAALASVNLAAEMLDKPVQQLSGGEKQRIGLLRNLQFTPDVLLLDEVTSALDEENKQGVQALIYPLVAEKKIAVVWVSHEAGDAPHATGHLQLGAADRENHRESA
ncbi:iron efflux ABC transporter ATP-binding subunit FetA [Candidatus Pantoea soli]|uniref:ATP-binding cassette domain-containing protein n=1 Tax=Candidatus Pantoea soli TaxID=3098669 RepID=A0A518XIV9_9GAMM|nr:ATP-binding cassette domain-containing protein [Pantoea soli]QDY44099.1 ATP-binding cassette domain-containing protein [Pantoea soli]